jgi:acetyl/propionyl-CoA carboxylase alpha subunit
VSDDSGARIPDGAACEVAPLGRGQYRVSEGGRHRLAYAAGPSDARWVFLDGRVFVVDLTPQSADRPARARVDEMALASPMPATVTTVAVTAGQDVSPGDVLITLEAMKMELPIKAPRAGRIKGIRCRPGDLVQPGVPLLELE